MSITTPTYREKFQTKLKELNDTNTQKSLQIQKTQSPRILKKRKMSTQRWDGKVKKRRVMKKDEDKEDDERYLKVIEKFEPVSHGERFLEKNELETQLDEAIEKGEIELAEKINNELIKDEKKEKNDLLDNAKRFEKMKKKKEEKRLKKKGPNLFWRFQAKKRWESKGNM